MRLPFSLAAAPESRLVASLTTRYDTPQLAVRPDRAPREDSELSFQLASQARASWIMNSSPVMNASPPLLFIAAPALVVAAPPHARAPGLELRAIADRRPPPNLLGTFSEPSRRLPTSRPRAATSPAPPSSPRVRSTASCAARLGQHRKECVKRSADRRGDFFCSPGPGALATTLPRGSVYGHERVSRLPCGTSTSHLTL